jgi:hypothetical protein
MNPFAVDDTEIVDDRAVLNGLVTLVIKCYPQVRFLARFRILSFENRCRGGDGMLRRPRAGVLAPEVL